MIALALPIWQPRCGEDAAKNPGVQAQAATEIPGEYLIRCAKSQPDLAKMLSPLSQASISSVEPRLFLIHFEKDPGLDAVSRLANKLGLGPVQPNYRYATQPGPGGLRHPGR